MPVPAGAKVRTKGKGSKRVLLFIKNGKVVGAEKPKGTKRPARKGRR